MAIRVRRVEGVLIALCAVESDPKEGDLYLDDGIHYALATKFAHDWEPTTGGWGGDPELINLMNKEKVRDAQEEMLKWQAAYEGYLAYCVQNHIEPMDAAGYSEVAPFWPIGGESANPDASADAARDEYVEALRS